MKIQAIIFDWGDTVMRVWPEYDGPMVHWPRVEIIPGVAEALQILHPRYRLALATNAADSGEVLVRAALRRVEVEEHFDFVLTARELGVRKPSPAFFRTVLREVACAPQEAVMVGDEYQADVTGAKTIGLRAIWFNPKASPCPSVHPLYDAEVRAMTDLPSTLENLSLPDIAECMALLAEQEAPPGVLRHSEAVAAAAFCMASWLREQGKTANPLLAHRGGLLHDLDKISSRALNQVHGQWGARILQGKGYPELAPIVERHLASTIISCDKQPTTWEEKLVYYADKIVEGDEIVSVPERWEALCQRYPQRAQDLKRWMPFVLELEKEICAHLGFSADDLRDRLRASFKSSC